MPDRDLSARPNLERYKKQAKDLVRDGRLGIPEALVRIRRHHPRFHKLPDSDLRSAHFSRTDAQLVPYDPKIVRHPASSMRRPDVLEGNMLSWRSKILSIQSERDQAHGGILWIILSTRRTV